MATATAVTAETKLSIKLLVDMKAEKVLFAEVEKNFVDFLFHILSLPVGTVTKLLKDKGMNGCLHNIYESIENLNGSYMKSKDMIIKPECPVGVSSIPLVLFNASNSVPKRKLNKCSSASCSYYVAEVSYSSCPSCAKSMSLPVTKLDAPATGGFVTETVKYMVMDDLVVKPLSISNITSLKECFSVNNVVALQEEVVQFGKEEALKLLKLSLESNRILTSLFMSKIKAEK